MTSLSYLVKHYPWECKLDIMDSEMQMHLMIVTVQVAIFHLGYKDG